MASRGRITRGAMVTLMRQGWPAGEALDQALKDCALDWVIAKPGGQLVSDRAIDDDSASDQEMQALGIVRRKRRRNNQRAQLQSQGKGGGKQKASRTVESAQYRTVSMIAGGKRICKYRNDPRGCRNKDGHCPNGLHVCDRLLRNGKACADPGHTREHCPGPH